MSVCLTTCVCPAVGCCVLAFSIGLLFVQRSGNYFVTMFDDYSATLPLLIVVILENVAIAWLYGIDKYVFNIHHLHVVLIFHLFSIIFT